MIISSIVLTGWQLWLILAAILVIIELLTGTFAAFCLVGGCIVAMIGTLCGGGLKLQLILLTFGTVVTFLAIRPTLLRKRAAAKPVSNMDALIGRIVTVTDEIRPGAIGRVKADGDNWQAVAPDNQASIPAGCQVRIIGYDSIILRVEQL
ncbi:MAG: NfeD family protein [Muribaculaceae bacterium]